MSTYGNEPPENPYGQTPPPPPQPGYGSTPPPPPQAPYGGQPGYGATNPYGGAGGYGAAAPAYNYAGWGARVGAYLLDYVIGLLFAIPIIIGIIVALSGLHTTVDENGYTSTTGSVNPVGIVLVVLGALASFGFAVWNRWIKQGRTGYTIGKGVVGIKLVREADGQPVGGGAAFVRDLCHILDSFCYLGFLWPLWDAKKQTFADKIMTTVVVTAPKS